MKALRDRTSFWVGRGPSGETGREAFYPASAQFNYISFNSTLNRFCIGMENIHLYFLRRFKNYKLFGGKRKVDYPSFPSVHLSVGLSVSMGD